MLFAWFIFLAFNSLVSVLLLICCFISCFSLYLYIGADYLAMLILIIYIGAIAIMFIFVVMFLNLRILRFYPNLFFFFYVFFLIIFLSLFFYFFFDNNFYLFNLFSFSTVRSEYLMFILDRFIIQDSLLLYIGALIFIYYWYYLCIVSFILLVCLIGVILLVGS